MTISKIRPWLYIGKWSDTIDLPHLSKHKIDAMLQFAQPEPQPGIEHLFLPVIDAEPIPPELLSAGLSFIQTHHQQGHHVLVACAAGISRSAAFCVAALKQVEGLSLIEAYKIVRAAHPPALPHPDLWESLCQHFPDEPPYADLWADLLVI